MRQALDNLISPELASWFLPDTPQDDPKQAGKLFHFPSGLAEERLNLYATKLMVSKLGSREVYHTHNEFGSSSCTNSNPCGSSSFSPLTLSFSQDPGKATWNLTKAGFGAICIRALFWVTCRVTSRESRNSEDKAHRKETH